MRKLLFPLLALIPLTACTAEVSEPEGDGASADEVPAAGAETGGVELAAGEYHVQCGCAIESVGVCGEYVEVDGEMVALEFPEGTDLGSMPFCGQADLVAEVEGEMVEGTFVATSFAMKE